MLYTNMRNTISHGSCSNYGNLLNIHIGENYLLLQKQVLLGKEYYFLRLKSPRFQALTKSAQAAGLNIFIGGS